MTMIQSIYRSRALAALCLLCAVLGCDSPARSAAAAMVAVDQSESGEPAAAAQPPEDEPRSYPPGRWRLANPEELRQVVLWPAHLLIRHRHARQDAISFGLGDWRGAPPLPDRSYGEGLALAKRLASEAQRAPEHFADLVATYSEDPSTRTFGGSLGGLPASQLLPWGRVLDALAATPEGQASDVVQTEYGFHVLLHRPPPPEQRVTGARIVIAHTDARWIQVQRCTPIEERSRAQAWQRANDVYQRLLRSPERYAEMVARYSDHCDAREGGDFGTWSTHEPSPFAREIDVLRGLAVGAIAAPFDSPVGIQILVRRENRPRQQFAMDPIRLLFDPDVPDTDPSSRASVRRRALALARQLVADPSRFAALKAEAWLGPVEAWREGAESPLLSEALQRLAFGQIAAEPIESGWGYVIPKRIDPATLPPPAAIRFTLPSPAQPDLAHWVSRLEESARGPQFRIFADEALATGRWTGPVAAELTRLHDVGESLAALTPEQTVGAFGALQLEVRHLLGEQGYDAYLQGVQAHFERLVLGPL